MLGVQEVVNEALRSGQEGFRGHANRQTYRSSGRSAKEEPSSCKTYAY
jgi:hypothetical protein